MWGNTHQLGINLKNGFDSQSTNNFAPQLYLRLDGRFHDDVIKWNHFSRYWPFVNSLPGVTGRWIPSQRPVTRSFDIFFDLRLNKRLSKQSWRRWIETPSRSFWRHSNWKICRLLADGTLSSILKKHLHFYTNSLAFLPTWKIQSSGVNVMGGCRTIDNSWTVPNNRKPERVSNWHTDAYIRLQGLLTWLKFGIR